MAMEQHQFPGLTTKYKSSFLYLVLKELYVDEVVVPEAVLSADHSLQQLIQPTLKLLKKHTQIHSSSTRCILHTHTHTHKKTHTHTHTHAHTCLCPGFCLQPPAVELNSLQLALQSLVLCPQAASLVLGPTDLLTPTSCTKLVTKTTS